MGFDEKVGFDKKVVRYVIYQLESCPKGNRRHWQGYIELYEPMRVGQVKKILGECHLELRRGSRQEARAYCCKKASAIVGKQFEFGVWREDVNRKRKLCDMLQSPMTLEDLIDNAPHFYVMYHRGLHKLYNRRCAKRCRVFREVAVQVLVGPTGCGKTRRATAGDDWFMKPAGNKLWMDNYDGESTLILDDFYGKRSGINYPVLLRMLDGHSLQLPVKGGFVWAQWTKVIITSNAEPSTWYVEGLTPALNRRITSIIRMAPVVFINLVE